MEGKLDLFGIIRISLLSALFNVFICIILTETLLTGAFAGMSPPPAENSMGFLKFYFSTAWSVSWLAGAYMINIAGFSQMLSGLISLVPLLITGFFTMLIIRFITGMFPYSTSSRETFNLIILTSIMIYTLNFIIYSITLLVGMYLYPGVIQIGASILILYIIGLLLTVPVLWFSILVSYGIIYSADKAFLTFK